MTPTSDEQAPDGPEERRGLDAFIGHQAAAGLIQAPFPGDALLAAGQADG